MNEQMKAKIQALPYKITTRDLIDVGMFTGEGMASQYRSVGKGPKFYKEGSWVFYRKKDVLAYIKEHMKKPSVKKSVDINAELVKLGQRVMELGKDFKMMVDKNDSLENAVCTHSKQIWDLEQIVQYKPTPKESIVPKDSNFAKKIKTALMGE